MANALNQRGHYALAVNGHSDHVHLFFDYSCKELIPDIVREIKKSSSKFIKQNKFTKFNFEWQGGYGVFSHGYREKKTIINYIIKQDEHHSKRTFKNEYLTLLKKFDIDFNDQYVFNFLEDVE